MGRETAIRCQLNVSAPKFTRVPILRRMFITSCEGATPTWQNRVFLQLR